jgi:NAD(P)-dependent dehydrogenase (short-subunit alcohol dehydrogenase family)
MSKHAVEAFTDALAGEMEPVGVKVSVIEPGQYKSDIWKSAAERGNVELQEAEQWKSQLKDPDEVAAATADALSEETPKRRYLVVPGQDGARAVIESQLSRLAQVNEGQPYTYDGAALIKMLDEALAHARPGTR